MLENVTSEEIKRRKKIDLKLELLKNQKSMIVENMDLIDFVLKI